MTERQDLDGKAAVRLHLVQRLEAAGFTKPSKVTKDAFEAGKKFWTERLAYMNAENLMVLAEAIIDTATSRDWPSETVVMQLARGIQETPVADNRAMSWLVSRAGPEAVARGDVVTIYRFIRRRHRPPMAGEMREIARQSAEDQRRAQLVREKLDVGKARQDEADWLEGWERDEREAMALVDQGNERRAGQ